MSTISAKNFVRVTPSVLPAGGAGLAMSGLVLTTNTRVPVGAVQSFPNAAAVATFFGGGSHEASIAGGGAGLGSGYFGGFTGAPQTPAVLLFAQYNPSAVSAYLRGGNVSALTLAQLQAIDTTLTVTMDGFARSANVNLGSATSFSNAASTIQTALNGVSLSAGSVTGSIAPESITITGSIAGNTLTVTATSGTLVNGAVLAGTGVTAGTTITGQTSGTTGGIGTYAVSAAQVVLSESITATYGLMTVTAVASGSVALGDTLSGSSVTTGTMVTQLGNGTGGDGTYYVSPTQTVGSESITASATPVVVSYDSVSGGFIITSGTTGTGSTAAFATGAAAAPLLLTSATGATLSQGAVPATPAAFMDALVQVTQNWACFMLGFDPDDGSGNTQKLAFAAWTNAQDDEYAFICWDTDASPAATVPASSSLGQILLQNDYSGTFLIWEPSDLNHAAFVLGVAPSIDFEAVGGRTDYDYLSQTGLLAAASNDIQYANLIANGYNFVGAVGSATENFVFLTPGSVSGPFEWMDSFINQIFYNNQFQTDLLTLRTTIKSLPYNASGYSTIETALAPTIQQGLEFGAWNAGVTLSGTQIAAVNQAAGAVIAPTLSAQGWYLQIQNASPTVRQARGSPPMTFWYCDGESIQSLNLASIDVQ